MIYRSQIIRALRLLAKVRNADGGIPGTKPGIVSGCWTTAQTLEALLSAPYHDADRRPFALTLINYLKSTQFTQSTKEGGWPLVSGGTRVSTMATGHATTALLIAAKYFRDSDGIVKQLQPLIETGLRWLNANKNDDGGWGVEPEGGADGKRSRMISTCYALRAYFADSRTVDSSPSVADGIRWITTVQQLDGGFSLEKGGHSDACNTARAINALLRSKNSEPNDKLVKRGIAFILSSRPRPQLWPLDTEQYVTEGAPGTTIFNSNTTSDVLESLLRVGLFNSEVEDLLDWYVSKELEDGGWHLGANDSFVKEVLTWSTNEAVLVLGLAAQIYVERRLPLVERNVRLYRKLTIALSMLVIGQAIFAMDLPKYVFGGWSRLEEHTRQVIEEVVVLGLAVNLAAAWIYDKIKSLRKKPGRPIESE